MKIPAALRRAFAVPGLPAAALLVGLAFLFEPAQVYDGNSPFFSFSILQLAPFLLAGFAICLAVVWAIAALGGPRWRGAWAIGLGGLSVAAWGTSTFLVSSKGLIDGRALLALSDAEQWRINAGFLAFGIAGALAAWRKPELARRFFTALFLVLLAHSGWLVSKDAKPWPTSQGRDDLLTLSQDRNVLVVLLDAFQADFFAEIARAEPAAANSLEGFTYFPNAVAHAPSTILSIPTIHSGAPVGENDGVQALYDKRVVEGSFVAKLAAAGFDAMVVNPIAAKCPKGARCAAQEAMVHGQGKAIAESSRYLLDLALFRIAPGSLKPHMLTEDAGARALVVGSDEVLDTMARDIRVGSKKPTLRWVHLFSTHAPAAFDGQCGSVRAAWSRASAIAQARCAVSRLSALLDALKDRGIYDQTAIVVLADHGSGMPLDEKSNLSWPGGNNWGSAASPLFLVKPFASRGPLATSPRVVGVRDLGATVCAWTRACQMEFGSDVTGREVPPAYPFVAYEWAHDYWFRESVPIENRYEVRGAPERISSWWRLTNLPQQPVSELVFGSGDVAELYGLGWSTPEGGAAGYRWAVGGESDLYVDLDPSSDAQLALQVSTHADNPKQVLTVEVNGTKVGELDVPAGVLSSASFNVPAGIIIGGTDRVLFRYTQWNLAPQDPRPLSVLFHNLKVAVAAVGQPAGPATSPLEPRYKATLSQGIRFGTAGYPRFLESVSGMSGHESWGRWTEGPVVAFRFSKPLPRRFVLKIGVAKAIGPNEGKPQRVRVGDWKGEFTIRGAPEDVELRVETSTAANTIELAIARPASPQSLGQGADPRELGLALTGLAVVPQ